MDNFWNNLPPGVTNRDIDNYFKDPSCIVCQKILTDEEFDFCVKNGLDFFCGDCRSIWSKRAIEIENQPSDEV